MSLIKQLWLAIALVLSAAFGISLVVNVYSARNYLQQQLQVKNLDNATSLALSLTQVEKDPALIELMVSTQFDIGHYRFIQITAPNGRVLVEKRYSGEPEGAPQWFARLIPIHTEPGQAQIQDGWKQYGTLMLASHDQYAYKSLWQGTLELLGWFVLGGLATGALGSLALRYITGPLLEVVAQAQALAERRFQTVAEPRTPELRAVTRAMNDMVGRIKVMFADEAQRLEALRDRVNRDAVSGLANRDYFMAYLREVLEGEHQGASGSLVVIRLAELELINAKLGYQRADQLLRSLGALLHDEDRERSGQHAGRVKGGEFALVCPGQDSTVDLAQALHAKLMRDWLPQWQAECPDLFHLAAVPYQRRQALGKLLMQADQALALAEGKGPNSWHALQEEGVRLSLPSEQWRELLTEAVRVGRMSLSFFPVVKSPAGQLLHREGVLRLSVEPQGHKLSAGDFMPMAAKLNLTAPIDLGVVKLAISGLREWTGDVAVNLSAETIANFGFLNQLVDLLHASPELCQRLLFEVPEYGVSRQFDAFQGLTRRLKALGCRVGIEYFGKRFVESDKLASLGLDYIKVDPGYVRGISQHQGNQEFLSGLCSMAHALGIDVIAVGVESSDELPLLARLGFDGATGPGIKWSEPG